jgi:hypothetical protein
MLDVGAAALVLLARVHLPSESNRFLQHVRAWVHGLLRNPANCSGDYFNRMPQVARGGGKVCDVLAAGCCSLCP